jgi:type IV pilus assembly protein PilM
VGLDIGTSAVRAVEVKHGRGRPKLVRMGQVALPPGAVVAGEVVEPLVVAAALRRLWRRVGFHTRSVVVGVANPRTVARIAELPELTDAELRSALPFHVQDLIPMPVADAELAFRPITRTPGQVRGLLVAAHREMLETLLAALDAADLHVTRIDPVAFALARVFPTSPTEVIVGAGAGVTNLVLVADGVPRFARTLPVGGDDVTAALARELHLDVDLAEGVKRAADAAAADAITARVVAELVDDIGESLRYLTDGGADVQHLVLTGGASVVRPLAPMLEEHFGVTVETGNPYEAVRLARIRLPRGLVRTARDRFSVAIGLALPASVTLDLLPRAVLARRAARRQGVLAGLGVVALAAGLGVLGYGRIAELDSQRPVTERAERMAAATEALVGRYHDIATVQATVAERARGLDIAVAGQVGWPTLLQQLADAVPGNAWLSSISVGRDAATGTANLQIAGVGLDQGAVATWLQRAQAVPALADVWLTASAADDSVPGRNLVRFTATATVGGAR